MRNEESKRRLRMSQEDIQEAEAFANYILRHQLHESSEIDMKTALKAFNTALVIAYSRPFKYNKTDTSFPAVGKLTDDYLLSFTPEEKNLHTKILALRDREFAHSDSGPVSMKLSEDNFGGVSSFGWVQTVTRVSLLIKEIEMLLSMTSKLLKEIERGLIS